MKVPRITRRQALAAGALVTAGTGAVGLHVASWWDRDAAEGYQALSADEVELVDALADALFPPGGTPALSGSEAGVARWFDGVMATMPGPTPKALRLLLHALDDWALATRGKRYPNLSVEARSDRLRSWMANDNHLVRGAVSSLTLFIAMGYCGHPEVIEACGWIWPCGFER